jgi:nucleoside-diphosphate-sugar epimerase
MQRPRLAILGASGFVGSTLCERLFLSQEFEFRALVHSFANTSRLARYPMELVPADVLSPTQVRAGLEGCDVVVNLSRGNPMQMAATMKNILRAARQARVKKVIHLSSISIYGDNPRPESRDESAPPTPDEVYGEAKLAQDELVLRMHRRGLPGILLCPANIIGPYSVFILGAVANLRGGQVALVDGGRTPTNHVHVENVVEAILAAVRSERGWGERYFVNEAEPVSWKDFYEDMMDLLGLEGPLPEVSREDALKALDVPKPRARFRDNFRVLLSGDFRKAMCMFPLFKRFNDFLYRKFMQSSLEFQQKVRRRMERPTVIPKDRPGLKLDNRYIKEQLKSVYHSPRKIMDGLGFRHVYSYRQGMETVRKWLEFANLTTDFTVSRNDKSVPHAAKLTVSTRV